MTTSTDQSASLARASDLEIVRRASGGSSEARANLATRLQFIGRLMRVLNQRQHGILSEHDVEDAVQDAVAVVLGKLSTYNGECALETWLYSFCMHGFANARRKKLRRREHETASPEGASEALGCSSAANDREAIEVSLARIGPPASEVIRERIFHERSFMEIGSRLNVAEGTIKSWYYRGLRDLGVLLAKDATA